MHLSLSCHSTIDWIGASQVSWDVVVIGAGVAGASAAGLCASKGMRTLLVEAKAFPREKVCGGCLNQRAQESLRRIGVLDQLVEAGGVWLDRIEIHTPARHVSWPMPAMLSIRRSTLDAALVQEAVRRGAHFLPETIAKIKTGVPGEDRDSAGLPTGHPALATVQLVQGTHRGDCQAKCVLVADGLTRSSLSQDDRWASSVADDSRIGVQALFHRDVAWGTDDAIGVRTLRMVISQQGYVGISPTDDRMMDMAAAIDANRLARSIKPHQVVQQILGDCHIELPARIDEEAWLATPKLTRFSDKLALDRIFLLGDSIGYVEPFTGEGMSWALESAEAIVPIAQGVVQNWKASYIGQWNSWTRRNAVKRQRMCRRIAGWSRNPNLAAWILWMCQWCPPLRWELMRRVSR